MNLDIEVWFQSAIYMGPIMRQSVCLCPCLLEGWDSSLDFCLAMTES